MAKASDDAAFGFPSEFPYEFEPLSSPPVESVAGSTETESSDEEDFFAALTRRLSQASIHETRNRHLSVPISNSQKAEQSEKKVRVLAGSPQSTLSGIGSWSGRSGRSGDGSPEGVSRVPSPFSAANDAWEVISAAAGQVARMKMNGESSKLDFQTRGVLGGLPHYSASENRAAASFSNPNLSQIYNHAPQVHQYHQQVMHEQVLKQQQCGSSVWGRSVRCTRAPPQPAWPTQNRTHAGSGAVKRGCAGTGVFLPRQYVAPPAEPRKKTSCAAPVVVPAKVIHALNLNIDELNAFGDYDALLARRNALLMQQAIVKRQRLALLRREEAVATTSYEARLPQEWSY